MAFNSHWFSLGGLNKIYLTLMDLNVQYNLMANGAGRLLTNLLLLKLLDLLALFCLEQGCCF